MRGFENRGLSEEEIRWGARDVLSHEGLKGFVAVQERIAGRRDVGISREDLAAVLSLACGRTITVADVQRWEETEELSSTLPSAEDGIFLRWLQYTQRHFSEVL